MNTDIIIPIDCSLDQNTSLSISNQEYIRLAAGSRDYVVGNGKNTFSYCIVHTSVGFINLVECKKGFKIEWLSDPFYIRGVVADDQNNYYAELEIKGNHVRIPFDQLTPDKIHTTLFGKGVAVKKNDRADEALSTHLQWLLSKYEAQDAGQILGWRRNADTLSWHGSCCEPPLLQRKLTLPSEDAYLVTLSNLIKDNPPLQFVLCAAAASTVLAYLSITENIPLAPFGVSLVATSSKGKTTALQLAASIYSAPTDESVFSGFYGTQNALIHILGRHNGVAICYDESTIKNDLSSSSFVYMFHEGKEKLRMNPDGTLKERQSWLCTALFSSENYLVDMNRIEHLGLAARVMTLDEQTYTTSSVHSEAIKIFAAQNYGILGERLAAYLLGSKPAEIAQKYATIRDNLLQEFETCRCELTDRVSMNYAVIILTAELLHKVGLEIDINSVKDICVGLHDKLSLAAHPGRNLIIKIFNYICCEYKNLKGIKWTTNKDGIPLKVEIIETTFEKIVTKCGYTDIESALKFLFKDGYIVRPESGRRKAKISIDGVPSYGYRFDLKKVEEAFGTINDAVYSNVKRYKSAAHFSEEVLDIENDEEAVIHAGNYRIEHHKTAVSGRAHLL